MADIAYLLQSKTTATADYGTIIQRRLTVDFDGNLRMYSLDEATDTWVVSWQAITKPCKIHGACGENSVCSYDPSLGRKCSCLPGFKIKNQSDWSYGCQPEFRVRNLKDEIDFLPVNNVEFYGYDYRMFADCSLEMCKNLCLTIQDHCKGFQYGSQDGHLKCFPKTQFLNGHHAPDFQGDIYLKVPKLTLLSFDNSIKESTLDCSGVGPVTLDRTYAKGKENSSVQYLLWFACAVGGVEAIVCLLLLLLLMSNQKDSGTGSPAYFLAASRFRRYTYAELKKATRNFSQEIGRGAGGIVYKGILPDERVAAVKRLDGAKQGEAEFLAEISTIGKLNHMNLIEMWGYCAERSQRLLVYEYMKRGSLAANLITKSLDWKKRFEIALGTARGLAYLHEECLDWVLHCDVKPENILLDSDHQPRVADFGLSKLLNRSDLKNTSFSRMRGTRGYMAPEWVFNLPITSKVDVYSYGMVLLELVTGKSPANAVLSNRSGELKQRRLVTWVRDVMSRATTMESLIEEITDPILEGNYDVSQMEIMVSVALQCVEEDRNERPTMSQVVQMLVCQENDH